MPATARPGALVAFAYFDLPQGMQQLRCGDLADRAIAEGGIGRFEQPAVLLQRRLRPVLPSLLVQNSSATSRNVLPPAAFAIFYSRRSRLGSLAAASNL